jgi:hypothetical protein
MERGLSEYERYNERANERTSERANERTSERANERTSERANERTNERTSERASEERRLLDSPVESVVSIFVRTTSDQLSKSECLSGTDECLSVVFRACTSLTVRYGSARKAGFELQIESWCACARSKGRAGKSATCAYGETGLVAIAAAPGRGWLRAKTARRMPSSVRCRVRFGRRLSGRSSLSSWSVWPAVAATATG